MTSARLTLVSRRGWLGGAQLRAARAARIRGDAGRSRALREACRRCAREGTDRELHRWPWATRRPRSCALPRREQVDLIAMATHGHRFLADVLKALLRTASAISAKVPVLMIRHEAEVGPNYTFGHPAETASWPRTPDPTRVFLTFTGIDWCPVCRDCLSAAVYEKSEPKRRLTCNGSARPAPRLGRYSRLHLL